MVLLKITKIKHHQIKYGSGATIQARVPYIQLN